MVKHLDGPLAGAPGRHEATSEGRERTVSMYQGRDRFDGLEYGETN
jgi:hypothetical protein